MGEFPSGQRGQTVNLLLFSFGGSNPPSPTRLSLDAICVRTLFLLYELRCLDYSQQLFNPKDVMGDEKDVTPFFSVFMRVCGLFGAKSEKRFYRGCPKIKPNQIARKRSFRLDFQAGDSAFFHLSPFFPLSEVQKFPAVS